MAESFEMQKVCKMQIILKTNELKHLSDCSFEELLLPPILAIETEEGEMPKTVCFCYTDSFGSFSVGLVTFTLFTFINTQIYTAKVKEKRYTMEAYYSNRADKKSKVALVELRWPKLFGQNPLEDIITFKPLVK